MGGATTGANTHTLTGHTRWGLKRSVQSRWKNYSQVMGTGRCRLWEVPTRARSTHTLTGHTRGGSISVAFSPDGNTIASGSFDGTVLLWEFTPPTLPVTGDVNGDGGVNILDLVLVAGQFGQSGENRADVNGDGVVNILDLVLVASAFGNAAAAPAVHSLALGSYRDGRPVPYRCRCRGMAHPSAADGVDNPRLSPRHRRARTTARRVDAARNGPVAELPESVQPGDMDTVSPRPRRRCDAHDL